MEFLMMTVPFGIAFVLMLLGTPLLIKYLRRIKAGQSIREEGPQSHLSKTGTPTMGGLMMIAAVLISCFFSIKPSHDLFIILIAFFAYGALGFLDDFVKLTMKRNLGLTAKQKFALQILIAVGLAFYASNLSAYGTEILIPFTNAYWDLGIFYVPFVAFIMVAMANSVNLTDGLDGLASGVSLVVAIFLAVTAIFLKTAEAAYFCAALAGACLGFLAFNKHPAKIFMGDTGSMALGGGIAAAAVIMNIELIIPIAGGIYLAEAVSVILQVAYYKKTGGKRLFKMAPLHHHFELSGWKEQQVVVVFWFVTILLCGISWIALRG